MPAKPNLTAPDIRLLQQHLDGPQPINVRDTYRQRRIRELVRKQLLALQRKGNVNAPMKRPKHTEIRVAGRHLLAEQDHQ